MNLGSKRLDGKASVQKSSLKFPEEIFQKSVRRHRHNSNWKKGVRKEILKNNSKPTIINWSTLTLSFFIENVSSDESLNRYNWSSLEQVTAN